MTALAEQTWRRQAACRDADPSLFSDPRTEDDAKDVCARCPVSSECLTWAVGETLGGDHPSGVFGGLNATERAAWARRMRIRHGTTTGYTKDGCRQQCCRDAMAEAKARSVARLAAQPRQIVPGELGHARRPA